MCVCSVCVHVHVCIYVVCVSVFVCVDVQLIIWIFEYSPMLVIRIQANGFYICYVHMHTHMYTHNIHSHVHCDMHVYVVHSYIRCTYKYSLQDMLVSMSMSVKVMDVAGHQLR